VAGISTPVAFTAMATPDTSRTLTLVAGGGQSAAVGAALGTGITVRVADRFGNLLSGETVNFADSTVGGGTLSVQTAVTNATGQASTNWTLGSRVGEQSMRARLGARTERVSVTATAVVQFAQVYAGNYFTCGVTTSDRAFCWGFGEDGQRGIPAAKTANAPGAAVTTTDTLAGPFQTWRQISAGSSYVCAISVSRQLYCWGRLASATQANVPTLKTFSGNVLTFAAVSTSDGHSCALATTGVLGCVGSNSRGQLGDGTQVDAVSTYLIVGGVDSLYSSMAVGGTHTCAFPQYNPADSANTKRPRCWGANGSGQLGRGTVSAQGLTIVPVTMPSTSIRFDSTSLAAGAAHTCALTITGDAYCWGSNSDGQLGVGVGTVRDSVARPVAGGFVFSKLFAGEYHTCGVTTGGGAYCWGRNSSGQLGDGSTTARFTPVAVAGGLSFRSLALGELHTCGVASASGASGGTQAGAGVIYCWGDNEYGQLGLGTTGSNGVPVLTPQKVAGQP
jgi:alpha-tubulin suppressor-like RCC1 family protein